MPVQVRLADLVQARPAAIQNGVLDRPGRELDVVLGATLLGQVGLERGDMLADRSFALRREPVRPIVNQPPLTPDGLHLKVVGQALRLALLRPGLDLDLPPVFVAVSDVPV
ncbi:MAG: hypothetical protein IID31_03540 [Planctomycetes bacterium]|nr:hypothetical protein [Planctomycetota bacterium]